MTLFPIWRGTPSGLKVKNNGAGLDHRHDVLHAAVAAELLRDRQEVHPLPLISNLILAMLIL